ncbi:site-specific integrase [Asticcacaulis sp. SL142]|uniref:site-specific integrase n=1 Tax=Asticcacaulis sp. SL142 TaxID=2995155 RepID=UPI003B638ABD
MSVGRAAIRRAWQRGEITSAPFIIDEHDRSDEDEPYRLSKAEMRKLLIKSKEWPHLHLFIMISLNTLARPGAVLDLAPNQVDLDARLIDLNPRGRKRTKKGRPIVPITDTLLPYITRRDVSRFVNWHGKPIQSIKKGFATVVSAAGLSKDTTPYSLRHTMAAELRARGVPAWEVEGLLGHKLPGTTERYAKFAPDYLSQGAAAIDAYFTDILNPKNKFDGFSRVCVPLAWHNDISPDGDIPKSLMFSMGKMVDPTGIEPVTPTMST